MGTQEDSQLSQVQQVVNNVLNAEGDVSPVSVNSDSEVDIEH